MQVTYLCAVYSVFKDRRDDFCPSIGRQREGIFLDPLSKKIKKIFLDNKKSRCFQCENSGKTRVYYVIGNYLSAFSSQ